MENDFFVVFLEKENIETMELCRRLNISRGTVAAWRRGENRPSIPIMRKIASFYGISVDYMLGLSDKRSIEYGKNI